MTHVSVEGCAVTWLVQSGEPDDRADCLTCGKARDERFGLVGSVVTTQLVNNKIVAPPECITTVILDAID